MATGSGKTLLMHLNYRQFLAYSRGPIDNILPISPNEDLTQQHLDEFLASGISARRLDLNESRRLGDDRDTVRVTEITKLVTEKLGEGVRIPVEVFEGNNLIFVDEGHKGSGGEAWRQVRDALGETGFTFEYSATFGQALNAAQDESLTAEYSKAIVFNYSYRYFYDDGYGKDFQILNLQNETTPELTDRLLLANLLSFYEQQLLYTRQADEMRRYNLEQPLWVFVGSRVNVVHRQHGRARSDVLTVVRFLHRTLSDAEWATKTVSQLLNGCSGLKDEFGIDVFKDKFRYLRDRDRRSASNLYRDILARTLHTPSGGGLHIADIRGSDGELGLKASGSDDFFGLIYIGDSTKFKRLVTTSESGITMEEDALAGSLFDDLARPDTTIDLLIGSRKFIEGWSSWRVSNMGLLNVGRNEGSQIIQLFGRGVRLRGSDMTLKRSSALDGDHPEYIGLLETLNIFAVRANYMLQFRDYLQREGVPTEGFLELPLFIHPNREFLNKGLVVPRLDIECDFNAEAEVMLGRVDGVGPVFVDQSAKLQSLESGYAGVAEASASSGEDTILRPKCLELVDWDRVYLSIIDYKERKGMDNLVVRPSALKAIMEAEPSVYRLVGEEPLARPTGIDQWERLHNAVIAILKKYADKLYRRDRERWASDRMVYTSLDETDGNFTFNVREGGPGRYIVGVPLSDQDLFEEIESLVSGCGNLENNALGSLPQIYFDRHLYQPLLLEKRDNSLKISPPGLVESEQRFVGDVRAYWAENSDEMSDAELFLLRNQSRGAGVGFFENCGFYPDFILWIKASDAQRIVFVEPHGLIHEDAPEFSDKIQLHQRLQLLSDAIGRRSKLDNVTLDSYVISQTPYEKLRKRWSGEWSRSKFAETHILFPERVLEYDYLREMVLGDRAVAGNCPEF